VQFHMRWRHTDAFGHMPAKRRGDNHYSPELKLYLCGSCACEHPNLQHTALQHSADLLLLHIGLDCVQQELRWRDPDAGRVLRSDWINESH
jgi:uncharacterized protein (DUF952 family)